MTITVRGATNSAHETTLLSRPHHPATPPSAHTAGRISPPEPPPRPTRGPPKPSSWRRCTPTPVRGATNSAYETTFLSRRNDPATCRTVIVMQRLHEDDFVGHVLGLGGD